MEYREVNGAALRYEVTGSGPRAVVLVHEMGATLESWDEVAPALARDRRVLRFDTRGAGLSEKIRGAADIDVVADDIAALLDAVGIVGKVALAGGAVGAAICLRFALRHPGRISAVVAMAPAIGLTPERRAATIERAAAIETHGMRPLAANGLDASWPPVMRGDVARFEAFRARWLGNDPASLAAIFRMLVALDMERDLARLACPVLVLAGRYDQVRPPAVVEPVARAIPGARYDILDTAHFMPAQAPALVAAAIRGFLESVGA
ncbi:MAG: alpha/beta fold hydrolase [Rhodospirillales bacterium]|nr:MAG: alpha/beta fold hydrolase [Rhodospirillales bacterium]